METQIITLICVQVETRAGHEVFVEVSGQLLESILSLHCVFWGSNSDPPLGLTENLLGHFARPSRTNYKDKWVPWYKGAFYKAESVFLLFANDGLELTKTG